MADFPPSSPPGDLLTADQAIQRFFQHVHPDAEDDLAASTLTQRLEARQRQQRERDLEWDEQDNARRARALLDRLFPDSLGTDGEGGILDDPSDSDEGEDVAMHDFSTAGERPSLANIFRAMAGQLEEDTQPEWQDEQLDFEGFLETGDEPYASTDLETVWPGFLGQQPLNPSPSTSRATAPPVVTSSFKPHRSLPRDPSSATSFTSFFQPGSVFYGEQTFGRAEKVASWRRRHPLSNPSRSSSSSASPQPIVWPRPGGSGDSFLPGSEGRQLRLDDEEVTTRVGFSPFPSATASRVGAPPSSNIGPSSSLAIPRPNSSVSSISSSRYTPYAAPPPPNEVSPSWHDRPPSSSSSADPPTSSSRTVPSSTRAPTSSSTASIAARMRARARITQAINPDARNSRESWREVEQEMLASGGRPSGGRTPTSTATSSTARGAGTARSAWEEQEQWAVKVIIQTYDPSSKLLTGVMRAHGVSAPSSLSSLPPTPADVLTHFTGHIIDPTSDGLFSSPSCTPFEGLKVSKHSEAESWIQLGPFKEMPKEELVKEAKRKEWVEERTRGWVLFRLKERGFVTVKEKESTLSIAGYYVCMLSRETGAIEGLYSDPTATPYQRLSLTATSETGAFSLGTFAMR
ncbi:hypothetical protein JCM8547_009361 [Rhodosporidiobolus lusitaniae]